MNNNKIYTDKEYEDAAYKLMANGWTGLFPYWLLNKVIKEENKWVAILETMSME